MRVDRRVLAVIAAAFVVAGAGVGAYLLLRPHHTAHPVAVAPATGPASATTPLATDTGAAPTSTTRTVRRQHAPLTGCVDEAARVRLVNGRNLSCAFARNIVARLTAFYRTGATLSGRAATFEVTSPTTHMSYSVTCSLLHRRVACHDDQSADPDDGHGNNDVTFPAAAVR